MAEAVDLPDKVTPLEPGAPVEAAALSQMGATLAERKAAREAAEKKASKAVDTDQADVEDKAVKPRRTRRK